MDQYKDNCDNGDAGCENADKLRAQAIADFEPHLRGELRRSPHTVRAYIHDIREFASFVTGNESEEALARLHIESLTVNDIRAWLSDLASKGESPRTLRRKTQSLRAFLRFMKKRHIVAANVASDVVLAKTDKPLPEFVRAAELESILQDRPDPENFEELRDALIVELLYATGMRRAEILGLSDSDFNFSSCEVRITGKRSKQRVVPLPAGLINRIGEYIKLRNREFPDAAGTRFLLHRGKPLSEAKITSIVKSALIASSSHKRSPHVLRHSFATAMLNNGANLDTVKEFLGHASLSTTQIYTHVTFKEMRANYIHAHPRASGNDSTNSDSDNKERD